MLGFLISDGCQNGSRRESSSVLYVPVQYTTSHSKIQYQWAINREKTWLKVPTLPTALSRAGRLFALSLLLIAHPGGGRATSYFAAPWAAADGDGGFDRPWPLSTALAHPPAVQPGDIIWLRGGVYHGPFTSRLTGAQGAPITLRAYPGERATLEGCSCPDSVLTVNGAWAWYWGFEIRSSDPNRTTDAVRGAGVTILAPNTKFINLIVHDNNQGFSFWTPAVDAELYGNLVYYNGWDEADRGHGHGVYSQNADGTKLIADNIIFGQFSHGIHIYGTEEAPLDNFDVQGNALFQNGAVSKTSGYARNLLLGGGRVARNANVLRNYTYYPVDQGAGENNLGYRAGCLDANVRENYLVGGTALAVINCQGLTFANNLVYGTMAVAVQTEYPDNQYLAARPSTPSVFVRTNRYERNRATIIVYNWQRAESVDVNLSRVDIRPGDRYEIRSAEDYYGDTLTGTYTGQPVRIPIHGWGVAQPVGYPKPNSALPEFGVFIVSNLSRDPAWRLPPRRSQASFDLPQAGPSGRN
jgi:hypothetical protein